MKTILVPVDFSATARNSALYAAGLAKEVGAEKIILFNAYSIPLATEMSWAYMQTEELQKASEEGLESFKEALQPAAEGIEIECRTEFGFLTESIEAVCEEVEPNIIVMGITGGGKMEEVFIGSNTVHVANHTQVPVVIVPPDAKWEPVKHIGWACDYKDVATTTPSETIKKALSLLKADLTIVHNAPQDGSVDPELFRNNEHAYGLFKELNPQYVTTSGDDFTETMNAFVADHKIDMLLVVPKRQGWLDGLFRRSHTKQLAFHSHVPLLCIKAAKPE